MAGMSWAQEGLQQPGSSGAFCLTSGSGGVCLLLMLFLFSCFSHSFS